MSEAKTDWEISCPKCRRSKLLSEIGGVRKGAHSKGKRILGWCKECRWFSCMKLKKVKVLKGEIINK